MTMMSYSQRKGAWVRAPSLICCCVAMDKSFSSLASVSASGTLNNSDLSLLIIQLNHEVKVSTDWSILGMSERHIIRILTFIEHLLYAKTPLSAQGRVDLGLVVRLGCPCRGGGIARRCTHTNTRGRHTHDTLLLLAPPS